MKYGKVLTKQLNMGIFHTYAEGWLLPKAHIWNWRKKSNNKWYLIFGAMFPLILNMLTPVYVRASDSGSGSIAESSIEELVMYNASQEDVNFIGTLKGLKKLEITVRAESNVDLTPLANLSDLEELGISVRGIWYEKTDLSQLGKLKQLKKLSISECSSDLSFINEMKDLQELIINNSAIDDLSFLEGLTELRYLSLKHVGDPDLSYLKGMSKMNQIYIWGHPIRNFECLGEMKYLTRVYLDDRVEGKREDAYDLDLNVFAEADSLSVLFLYGMRISDMTPVSRLPGLESITLVDTGVTDIETLKNLESLRRLEIYGYGYWGVIEQALLVSGLEVLVVTDDIPGCY